MESPPDLLQIRLVFLAVYEIVVAEAAGVSLVFL